MMGIQRKTDNEKGITLVEVVITIGLITVIALFAYIFIFQGLTLFSTESAEIEDQANVRTVAAQIIKRLRITLPEQVSVVENKLIVDGVAYTFDGSNIYYGEVKIAVNIAEFTVTLNGPEIKLHILSEAGKQIDTAYSLRQ